VAPYIPRLLGPGDRAHGSVEWFSGLVLEEVRRGQYLERMWQLNVTIAQSSIAEQVARALHWRTHSEMALTSICDWLLLDDSMLLLATAFPASLRQSVPWRASLFGRYADPRTRCVHTQLSLEHTSRRCYQGDLRALLSGTADQMSEDEHAAAPPQLMFEWSQGQ